MASVLLKPAFSRFWLQLGVIGNKAKGNLGTWPSPLESLAVVRQIVGELAKAGDMGGDFALEMAALRALCWVTGSLMQRGGGEMVASSVTATMGFDVLVLAIRRPSSRTPIGPESVLQWALSATLSLITTDATCRRASCAGVVEAVVDSLSSSAAEPRTIDEEAAAGILARLAFHGEAQLRLLDGGAVEAACRRLTAAATSGGGGGNTAVGVWLLTLSTLAKGEHGRATARRLLACGGYRAILRVAEQAAARCSMAMAMPAMMARGDTEAGQAARDTIRQAFQILNSTCDDATEVGKQVITAVSSAGAQALVVRALRCVATDADAARSCLKVAALLALAGDGQQQGSQACMLAAGGIGAIAAVAAAHSKSTAILADCCLAAGNLLGAGGMAGGERAIAAALDAGLLEVAFRVLRATVPASAVPLGSAEFAQITCASALLSAIVGSVALDKPAGTRAREAIAAAEKGDAVRLLVRAGEAVRAYDTLGRPMGVLANMTWGAGGDVLARRAGECGAVALSAATIIHAASASAAPRGGRLIPMGAVCAVALATNVAMAGALTRADAALMRPAIAALRKAYPELQADGGLGHALPYDQPLMIIEGEVEGVLAGKQSGQQRDAVMFGNSAGRDVHLHGLTPDDLQKAFATAMRTGAAGGGGLSGASAEACLHCGKTGVPLKLCGACRKVRYCSADCQKASWKPGGHKEECARLKVGEAGATAAAASAAAAPAAAGRSPAPASSSSSARGGGTEKKKRPAASSK